jgi:hypothetical protein
MGNDYDKVQEVIERGTKQLLKDNPPRLEKPLRLVKSPDEAADEAAKEAADEVYHAVMRTEMERAHIEAQDKAREASHAEYGFTRRRTRG